MKTAAVLIYLCLALTSTHLFADEKQEEDKKCLPSKDGSAWLQDFSATQKKAIDVEWEAEKNTATYELDGTYKEEQEKNLSKYSSYSNETSLEAIEKWKCGEDQMSEFVSMKGEMENELEWEMQIPTGRQTYEAEDEYAILNIDKVRQVEHESEKNTYIKTAWTQKEEEEELEWVQKWDEKGIPTITGSFESESTEESIFPETFL